MKRTNKGFTLVELIIVIAVIGVLAAILIPVFSNVIEKANAKSAFSDARNALSIYIADKSNGDGAEVIEENAVFEVEKASKKWYYTYTNNGLHEEANVHQAPAKSTVSYSVTGTNVPTNVTIWHKA